MLTFIIILIDLRKWIKINRADTNLLIFIDKFKTKEK